MDKIQTNNINIFKPSTLLQILNNAIVHSVGTVSQEVHSNSSIYKLKDYYTEFSKTRGFGLSLFKNNIDTSEKLFKEITSIKNEEGIRFFILKGYVKLPSNNYNNDNKLRTVYLHDNIDSKACIEACVTSDDYQHLKENQCYLFSGFIFNSIHLNNGEIKFKFNIVDSLNLDQTDKAITQLNNEIKKLTSLTRVIASRKKRELYPLIKFIIDKHYDESESIKINICAIHSSETIKSDIEEKLKDPDNYERTALFNEVTNIEFESMCSSNVDSILSALNSEKATNADIVCIGRGGGTDNDLRVFSDLRICQKIASMNALVMIALGHSDDLNIAANLVADYPLGVSYALTEKLFNPITSYAEEKRINNSNNFIELSTNINKITMEKNNIETELSNKINRLITEKSNIETELTKAKAENAGLSYDSRNNTEVIKNLREENKNLTNDCSNYKRNIHDLEEINKSLLKSKSMINVCWAIAVVILAIIFVITYTLKI